MDSDALVDEQIGDGARLVDELARADIRVLVAGWVKPTDEDRWSLYLATPLVDEKGLIGAYREVYRVLRSLDVSRVNDNDVKLIGSEHWIARDLLEGQPRSPVRRPQPVAFTSVGGRSVEGAVIYPPLRARSEGPKQSTLRFVLRADGDPFKIFERFHPQGQIVLNSTEWRGKEPRSCAVTNIRSSSKAIGDPRPPAFDIEVSYRSRGCITFTGGTKYDGWTAVMEHRATDGTLIDEEGRQIPDGLPPYLRRVEVFREVDFNELDFGEFAGEFEVPGVKHISYDYIIRKIQKSSAGYNASLTSAFMAPRKHRPHVKMMLSDSPSGVTTDGFGTRIVNVNSATPQLQRSLLDRLGELVDGFVEGRFSIKNISYDEFSFVNIDDILVDCRPGAEAQGMGRFHCLVDFLPESYLDELALRLAATYEVDVSVVDGPPIGLLLKRVEKSR